MSKITIRFTQDSVPLEEERDFYLDLFRSLGLKSRMLFDEQEFEITAQTKVTLFGMETTVPQGLLMERTWVCRLIKKEGMLLFSVGDWFWAAALRESSQPQEMMAKLPSDLPVLSLSQLRVKALPSLSGLSSLTSLNLDRCDSLVDISALSGLISLASLDLSGCFSLVDISALSGLSSLTSLSLKCCSMVHISALSDLSSLTTLDLNLCDSLVDISALSGLRSLISLDLSRCASIEDFSPLEGLVALENLNLSATGDYLSQQDLLSISKLTSLTNLDLRRGGSRDEIEDLSSLSCLVNLTNLDLSGFAAITDLSPLSCLKALTVLNLTDCISITDISPLSDLKALRDLKLFNCNSITKLDTLGKIHSLEELKFTSRRIQSVESLRNIPALREVTEFNPPEVAELLAHAAYLRSDSDNIKRYSKDWLKEAKDWREGASSLQDRFATTLGEAFSLLGEHPMTEDYEAFLDARPDFSSAPWKAWFWGTLKESGFALYCQRVERVAVSQMLPGAIGGACTTLPNEDQPDWSREWLMSLESARLSDAKNLLSVAPEICLAHARFNLSESLRRWLEAFTDPSDPGALDPVHAALAGFQLGLNYLDAAESHVFAIESPSLRDPVLADLISSYPASDTDRASAQLLLIAAPATRRELAKTLVTIPEYSLSEAAMQRLVVAMDDSPEALGELIALLPASSAPSQLIQQISASLQLDRRATLRRISDELHQQADRLLT
jgi:hypothetical protein